MPEPSKEGQIDTGLPPESGSTIEQPPAPSAATAPSTESKITVGDQTYTEGELVEKYQNSVTGYQQLQGERDRLQSDLQQNHDAWDWIRTNRRQLYDQFVQEIQGVSTGQSTGTPAGSTAPAAPARGEPIPEWFKPFANQIQSASQLAQAGDHRYWDGWAAEERGKAYAEYERIKGQAPSEEWKVEHDRRRVATGMTDLVLLTRGMLHEDVVAGRSETTTAGAAAANKAAQRGAAEGLESSAQVPVDLKDISDEDLYLRGKQALGLAQEDTRYVADK